ncbi:hypothetical protein SI65_09974 [Aspergillus cristatus]|uniref:Uncharacterized protein n=1 Tax=Aspergillus cristatus TaxID=573508 RepID=A0A1E3B137_ASPCR|nr:hypothetical protein SI65_09974 [Aspergillus cristatus]
MEYIPALGSDYIPTPNTTLKILKAHSIDILIPLIVFLLGGLVFWQRRHSFHPDTTGHQRNEVLKLSMMAKALRDREEDVVRTMLQEINVLSNAVIEEAIELLFTEIVPDTDFESFPDFMSNIAQELEENY